MSDAQGPKLNQAGLATFANRMRAEGLPEIATRSFMRALEFVASGGATTMAEDSIDPIDSVSALETLPMDEEAGREALSRTVVIKLNGGLGTSMGLSRAKSLLPVRPGLSFLDLVARQTLWQRTHWHAPLPLVLMNSYRTRADSLDALQAHAGLKQDIPLDFLQHKVPRIDARTWKPVEWPEDEELEWCPPGHGDLYVALQSSGMLATLRSNGIRYAFVSNTDNLGAVVDRRILGWFASRGLPFVMEVAQRTESDKKGGHLARRDGRLVLRETAQCPKSDIASFQDIGRHRYFNTNNLWLDLDALADALDRFPAGLPLPVMKNEKPVSSTNASSPRCYQLETAMGSAIEFFEGAEAILVPRTRFAPVKTSNDLLSLWSDAYGLTEDSRLQPIDVEATRVRVIELDARYYERVADLQARFPQGAPSLVKCRRLSISGDHRFGANVSIVGSVALVNETSTTVEIPSGAVLIGD